MKKKKIILLSTALACGLVIGAITVAPGVSHSFNSLNASANLKKTLDHSVADQIVFDGTNATLTQGSATYSFTGASVSTTGLINLAVGGTVVKDEARGLAKMTINYTGEIEVRSGFKADDLCFYYDTVVSGQEFDIRGNFFKIIAEQASEIVSIAFEYNCETASPESHTMSWDYDDNSHWKECGDSHCHEVTNYGFHNFVASGVGTDLTDTGGTIKLNCASSCGIPEASFDYTRSGNGWAAIGSSHDTSSFSGYGTSVNAYAYKAIRQTDVKVMGHYAPLFQITTKSPAGTDGTDTGAAFRIMTGFNTASASRAYFYYLQNYGEQALTLDIYGRSGGSDKSVVDASTVTLQPGQAEKVKVIYNQGGNINILSYFRFHDCNPNNALLAIGLEVSDNIKSKVTFTDTQFDDDSYSREFTVGSKITGLKDSNIVGAGDGSNCYALDTYTVDKNDVTFYGIEKEETVTSGAGLLDFAKGSSGTDVGNYGSNTIAKLGHAYIGSDYATLLSVKGVNGATTGDGCGNNASFRTLTSYNIGSETAIEVKYTIMNQGDQAASFDLYHRISGSDSVVTDPIESISFSLNAGATDTKTVIYATAGSNNNLLTYFKATSDFTTKLAIRAEVINTGKRVELLNGATFTDGSTKGIYALNDTPATTNIASYPGYSHVGWASTDSSIACASTTLTVNNHMKVMPYYDCDYISSISSTEGKYNFGAEHPNGRVGSFATKMVGKSNGVITDGMPEKGMRLSYANEITAGSTFIIYNGTFALSSGTTSIKFRVQNVKDAAVEFDLYQLQSSTSAFPLDHKIGTISLAAKETKTFEFSFGMYSHNSFMMGWSFGTAHASGMDVVMTCYLQK